MKKLSRKNLSLIIGGQIWHCLCGNGMTVTATGNTTSQATNSAALACNGTVARCTRGLDT